MQFYTTEESYVLIVNTSRFSFAVFQFFFVYLPQQLHKTLAINIPIEALILFSFFSFSPHFVNYRRKKKCIRYMEGDSDDRGNDMDDMGGNMSDDNLGSCGSVDDVKTPPEDDIESLNHSLSSPGAFSGLSCLQSPSTSLASPLTPNAVLYNNNHIINNILNNNSSNNNSTSSSNHDNENNSSNDNNNNENNENRDNAVVVNGNGNNGVVSNNRNEINNIYRTPGNSAASNNASNETNSNPSSSNREPLRLPPGCCGANEMAAILAG